MSDILIRGMELPGKCGHCRFADAFDCGVDGKFIPTHDTRRTDCLLVPIPPHGRLIDADALLGMMLKLVDEETFRAFRQAVNDAPTIIPASE